MHELTMSGSEIGIVQRLLGDLSGAYHSVEDPEFLRDLPVAAQELPRRIRMFFNDFRLSEPDGACLIAGYPVDQDGIGPTPRHWKNQDTPSPTLPEEMFFMLCGSLLGDVFGWATQQDGHLVHDVIPIKEHEREQIASGSQQLIWWHTEDAFHPFKGDYVALMCLRNPDRVETTVASAERIPWDEQDLDTLFEANYYIRPDESHLPKNRGSERLDDGTARLLDAAYQRIADMNANPRKRPILSGDRESPYLCLDPYFMDIDQIDGPARQALDRLSKAIDATLEPLVLEPGDCCFIDNYKAVHGRNPFKARYDGTDRWLKRLNITRNLRDSRPARRSSATRVVF
ncbi:guanitoxin biosynthesis L-enduracididine beta-hydroxylase GntD [Actinocrispum wychmicini]|uniref:Fe(II)/alpha-ketoglutarate-dependent arginine beta-hydroxylase n=1 Tax=Actinocrispum wychmicini TaxID=1213861 RepID=A0A4R2JDD6_9PSEU|nr:guanitoxin biosynthesis L-enduracididine beta-hydroxylase GntD [Actinocrispum wychmicini]TCO54189.1 Fe(II)/alpha-ketoglutarate-dependent arginine beta-hydroxylase [Actinocrispum wychmicini]